MHVKIVAHRLDIERQSPSEVTLVQRFSGAKAGFYKKLENFWQRGWPNPSLLL
jgi:hypothetical protein